MAVNIQVARGIAFIFDMDGVIVESTATHTRAWDIYLERAGKRLDGVAGRMFGKRNDEIVRDFWGPELPEEEVAAHGAAKERLYRELMGPVLEAHIVKGVREFVRAAHEAGIPLALATNAEPANVEFILDHTGLRDCLALTVDGYAVKRPKPDPEVYLEACARLGVAPRNTVVFEDSPGGMKAARAAGAHLVAVLTTLMEAPEADLAVADFLDPGICPWLNRLSLR